ANRRVMTLPHCLGALARRNGIGRNPVVIWAARKRRPKIDLGVAGSTSVGSRTRRARLAPAQPASLGRRREAGRQSDRHRALVPLSSLASLDLRQGAVDVGRGYRPVVVEVGDDLLHEGLGKSDSAILVAQVVVKDGERQLLWTRTLVGPLEAPLGELLHLVVLRQRPPVDGHLEPVNAARAPIGLHAATVARVKVSV